MFYAIFFLMLLMKSISGGAMASEKRTVSPRSLIRCKHIFITPDETGKKFWVKLIDFTSGKTIGHSGGRIVHVLKAYSENDIARFCRDWAVRFKVPPEAIIRGKTPEKYHEEYKETWGIG
jgi:hypothetical protein